MDNKINGRTPEEILKGLEMCRVGKCSECPYREECDEHLVCGGDMLPADVVLNDIAALIQQLEAERDQYRRERDAAVEDMTELMQLAQFCRHCKHITTDGECTFDFAANKGEPWCWQWRGVQEVE